MLEKNELLPWLIDEHNCKTGVEIGVRDADNAARLLQLTSIYLYGVDIRRWPQIDQLYNAYPHRFKFYHMASNLASDFFSDGELDFIYIDADHNYASVMQDIIMWYPKLKVGGVFSGDDYCNCWNPAEGQYGIVKAVEEFIEDMDVEISISGLGVVSKAERKEYADRNGALHEDNFTGRKRTENVPVPQWWFIKKDKK